MDRGEEMVDFVGSFEKFLKEKHPGICLACWGEGRVLYNGMYVKNIDIQCPECKGTGKEK